jgi:hypothetical protein
MKTKIYSLFAILTLSVTAWSQGVGINETGSNPDPSAILDVESTDKGFLPPRMTTAQRNGITSPATGLIIYNTDENCVQTNSGTPATPNWQCMTTATSNKVIFASSTTPTYNGENVIIDLNTGAHPFRLPNPADYTNQIIFYRNASVEGGGGGTASFNTYVPIDNPTVLGNRGMVLYSDGTNWRNMGGL